MSIKSVYFYKTSLFDNTAHNEIPINQLKPIIDNILDNNATNDAIILSPNDAEPIAMDIIERCDEYIFVRLSKKRLNNSVQRRNYNTLVVSPVLTPIEAANNGIELFTYCILGYSHGILSIANSKGAPNQDAWNRLFALYDNRYYLEITSMPNTDLINELYNGDESEINRITIETPVPDQEILEQILGLNDAELLHTVQQKTNTVVFEIKPEKRGALCDDSGFVKQIIDAYRAGRARFNRVVLDAKSAPNKRQMGYDLYEEYFKYPISISEYHTENGQKVEYPREEVQRNYRNQMMGIYDDFKDLIVMFANA